MRLTDLLVPRGCRLTFEDGYTDISLYIEGERPVVCYEVKEHTRDLDDLIRDLRRLEEAIVRYYWGASYKSIAKASKRAVA